MGKKKRDRSSIKLNIWWIILLFIAILIMSFFYIGAIKDLVYKNIYHNITELSEQTATQLNLAITDQKRFVEIIILLDLLY